MDEDELAAEADRKKMEDDGNEGVDVDQDAMAFIKSRKDVLKLRQARKNQWMEFKDDNCAPIETISTSYHPSTLLVGNNNQKELK